MYIDLQVWCDMFWFDQHTIEKLWHTISNKTRISNDAFVFMFSRALNVWMLLVRFVHVVYLWLKHVSCECRILAPSLVVTDTISTNASTTSCDKRQQHM